MPVDSHAMILTHRHVARYDLGMRHPLLLLAARAILPIACAIAAAGCSKDPDPTSEPGSAETITGRERIGWNQQAEDGAQLARLRYAIYVDGARSEVGGVSCTAAGPQVFSCSGKGPDLTPGPHTLELAAFTGEAESPRSAPFSVVVNRATAGTSPAEWPDGSTETTADGVTLRIDKVAEGLEEPVDAAFTPDGRLFIAERRGRVRIVDGGRLQAHDALTMADEDPGARLLSIAIDPDFERSRFVFLVQATRTGAGEVFRLARYREVGGTLAQRAVLVEAAAPPIADAGAVLRPGPDGKLYLAVGAAGTPGTLLRLNLDGTMPRDQAGSAPAVAQGVQFPTGLAAHPGSGLVWIADEQDGQAHLSGIALAGRPLKAVVRARHPLTGGGGSLAFYAGDTLPGFENTLLVASPSGRHIERIRFSREQPDRIAGTDTLLQDAVGPIQVVTVSPGGAIYFCAGHALGRLTEGGLDGRAAGWHAARDK